MEIVYRAFDGKEFTNEIECRAHEEQLQAKEFNSKIHLWDEDREVMELNTDTLEDFTRVMYFRCDTEDAYQFVLDMNVKEGYAKGLPSHNGANIAWAWNSQESQWEQLKEQVKTLEETLSVLNSMCYMER